MARYYITHSDTLIFGIGTAPAGAEADALNGCADLTGLGTTPCTAALYHKVLRDGGAIAWGEVDGVACTRAAEYRVREARAQQARDGR